MPHITENHSDALTFVPPEPYKKPGGLFDPSLVPRWVWVLAVIIFTAFGILAIWFFAHK